jgi:hypothetical protein
MKININKGKCGKRWINQEINKSVHTHTHDMQTKKMKCITNA